MVLENLFAGVVNQFLGNYIENVASRDMSFGLDGRWGVFNLYYFV